MDFKARAGGFSEEPDKIDMSLDDIIRLNKKQRQTSRKGATKLKVPAKGRLSQGRRTGSLPVGPNQRGGVTKFGIRGHKVPLPVKRRRGQGVITGLAARKSATLFKGISPLNRPATDQLPQKSRPFVYEGQRRRMNIQRRPYRQTDAPKPPHTLPRRPIQLHRTALPIHQAQREARQATFLHRRGLKVQASVQKSAAAPVLHRTRPWRTSTTNSGILTVCIDNPSARTQPEPARAWSLHPQSSPAPVKVEKEPERKPPKGVSLQFDINSVGKQTAMTLNDRFRVLKERRTTAAAQSTKGSRYVTVG